MKKIAKKRKKLGKVKDLFEKAIDDAALDFADLAEEVMGNTESDELS